MSPLLFLGIGLTFLANILHIVGVATTHWFDLMSGLLFSNLGLFKKCTTRDCYDLDGDSTLNAVRAFCIIGILLAFACITLGALFVIIKSFQSNKMFPILMMLCGLAACGSILVGIIIYASEVYDSRVGDYGFSFALSIVGALGIAAGGVLSFIGARSSAS